LAVKFPDPELKAKAQQLYEEQLKKEGNQQWLWKISVFMVFGVCGCLVSVI
jgi:hypothetical protein